MYRIGIDLGGTNIAAGLVSESMAIVDKTSVKTNIPRSMESIVDDMLKLINTLISRNALSIDDIRSVGVGVPCTANQQNGHMEDANNLGFDDTPFLSLLAEKLTVPVFFDNDANVAAWGEYKYRNSQEKSLIMVTIGTGIGGGIILNDSLWSGINGAAGEFGHMTISSSEEPCNCGRKGCLEAAASAIALISQARREMISNPHSVLWELCGGSLQNVEAKHVFDGAALGDKTCEVLLDKYTTVLSEGMANVINLFQPAVLCIGGGVSRAGEALIDPLRTKTMQRIYSKNSKHNPRIELAMLDNDAGILGAAMLGSKA